MVSLWLADYTWPDVEKLLGQGFDTLLLMLGATEQHGPHLPLSTDTIVAETLALDVATRLGQTLVAPDYSNWYVGRTQRILWHAKFIQSDAGRADTRRRI